MVISIYPYLAIHFWPLSGFYFLFF
uniref:Uncharacterized protein n=1 Tax=Rhizophora mucronata TaxID=61149 RepID=A0A2P2ITC3_RHIMU